MEILKIYIEEQLLIKYFVIKHLILLKIQNMMELLASIVYKFVDQKNFGGTVKNEIISNKELAEKLHKRIVRKFEIRKVHSPFIDNVWAQI